MPLHGKIVVIKRSGGDGTEFPLAASCLFGRKTDCDIRIQLPQVSKEHCRIDLNENKEVIVTNLSSANPTCVNGEALQQSERLKHGDVITIIDRSFRFEYPPPPTPKKRSSIGGKAETLKVLQDHQVGSITTVDKRISEASSDPHLKVGTNHDNVQRSLEKTLELECKGDGCLPQNKDASPFNDLYQMIKKSLDVKTPRKSSASVLQTPSSKFCTPQPQSVRKSDGTPFIFTACKGTPKREAARISPRSTETKKAKTSSNVTPQSVKKQKRSPQASTETEAPDVEPRQSKPTSPQTRRQATPQKFAVTEAIEQLSTPTPKSPVRRSKENTPVKERVNQEEVKAMTSPKTEAKRKATPRSSEKGDQVKELPKKRKSGELGKDLPMQERKKKRVSFGGHLSPELFDKRLPPDSPLRKGATPRRSLSLLKPKESLLRRASVIGLMKFGEGRGKNASPKTPTSAKKSPATKTASPKTPSPGKKSPASKTASPKTPSPGKKSPASKTASPKTPSPGKKSPASKTASPKTPSPGKKSPASKTASPKTPSPASKIASPKTPTSVKKSPASKTPTSVKKSPASKTPTSVKKSPASKTASPKTPTSVKKSPASKTASPKTPTSVKKSPAPKTASPKAPSPGNELKTPKGNDQQKSTGSTVKRRLSPNMTEKTPTAIVTPVKTPSNSRVQTPTTQGRFSVSRINTPSPIVVDNVTDMAPSTIVTPKMPLRRKSMKSTAKKTPGLKKSAVKVIRRSGVSRVSIKAMNSWADIVKFGQAKVQRAAPRAKCQAVPKKTVKKVPKPQTPARRLKDLALASTGHANSPATIVVGRAVKQSVVHNTGAAPRVVMNTALSKKDMKMDEDMTGISEMFKTPVHERERSVKSEKNVLTTPAMDLSRSMVEPSMLNTPEEPGQMTVSPLTVKVTRYNSEAVQRLLNGDEEATFVGDLPSLEINSDSSEQQPSDVSEHAPTTPNQKIELSDCLTGVKRIMKTPKQQREPVEDLRGKLLKTPKQKPEPKECLTGVKRIMKTPKVKAEAVDDIRGNLLKTPMQKTEQPECLTGVKRLVRTPRQKSEPVEDIRGNLLKTPKQKIEQPECLSGVKQFFNIPQWDDEPLEEGTLDDAEELLDAPKFMQESDNLCDEMTKETESSPSVLLSDIKIITKTPKEKSTPVEDMVGLKRLMKTPKEKIEPVDKNFGIKRLMKSPRLRGVAPVEDFEGLEELMKEPPSTTAGQEKTVEIEEQILLDYDSAVGKELDVAEDPQDDADMAKADPTDVIGDDKSEEVHVETGVSDVMDTVSESVVDGDSPKDQVELEADEVMCSGTEEVITQAPTAQSLALEMATSEVTEVDEAVVIPDVQKKSVRGRRAKVVKSKAADDEQQVATPEDPVIPAPVRGRRGKKTEAPAPPAVRQTARGRNAKTTELQEEESVPMPTVKPKRGNAKKATEEQAETVQEVPAETEEVPEDKQTSQIHADPEVNDAEPQEKPVVKQASVTETDMTEDANEVVSAEGETNTMDATETEAPEMKTETFKVTENEEAVVIPDAQKKPARGRRAKAVEPKVTDAEQEAASEEPVVPTQGRGRRGKKTEAPAPPAVRQTTRGRNAKTTEAKDEPKEEESVPMPTVKPKRGNAKKATEEQAEIVEEVPVETEGVPEDKRTSQIHADHEVNDDAEPQEKPVVKQGKKSKQASVPQTDMAEDANEVVSAEGKANTMDATETEAPEMKTETINVTENEEAVVIPDAQKKPARGRRAKAVEPKVTDAEQEAASEEPVVPTQGRGRRGKKTEAAVRQTTRGRNVKAQQGPADEKPEKVPENSVETQMVTEHTNDQTSVINVSHEDDVPPPAEEKSISKPKRGRKAKPTPVEAPQPEPESTEVVNEQHVTEDIQPELPVPTVDKPKRGGRKTKVDAGKQNEVTEDTVVPEETKQVSRPPTRAKKGRNAKEEEKPEKNEPALPVETPAKKMRRTRKAEEPSEEVPTANTSEEMVVPIPAQTEKINEVTQVSKPRRGAQKAQGSETVTPVESTEVQEVPVVSSTDKPKKGRRGKQAAEVTEAVPEEKPEHEPQTEEKTSAVKTKTSRARGVKTSAKNEASESVPAKRARRGAAVPVEESSGEVTDVVPEPAPLPVVPVKRGQRAATKAKANTEEMVSSDQVNATEDSSNGVEDNTSRTVKFKADVEVFAVTPLTTVRGRRVKSGDQNNSVSKRATKTEEKDLSDQKSHPVKRARRGAKVIDITEESTNKLPEEDLVILKKDDAEAQPKTRRGRLAKK